jgi:hypothetical protein
LCKTDSYCGQSRKPGRIRELSIIACFAATLKSVESEVFAIMGYILDASADSPGSVQLP